jgi:SAM-dependent methyltransferase
MSDDATRQWLDATWRFVRDALPPAPARVIEIGCGSAGGFLPALEAAGYNAVGVDPEAPEGARFHRVTFERYAPPAPVDAVVACTSLHHVDDLDDVTDRIAAAVRPGGTLVVVEWARERFDERTARWCFDRLPTADGHGWLHEHAQRWRASGQPWPAYVEGWAAAERLHRGDAIVAALGRRFRTRSLAAAPYFFADLGITEDTERGAGIALTGLRYVGEAQAL